MTNHEGRQLRKGLVTVKIYSVVLRTRCSFLISTYFITKCAASVNSESKGRVRRTKEYGYLKLSDSQVRKAQLEGTLRCCSGALF
jgi:hypothetical protein